MTPRRRVPDYCPAASAVTALPDECAELLALTLPLLEAQSGVYRRDLFSSRLHEELERADRDHGCLTVLLVEPQDRPRSGGAESIGRFLMCVARQQDTPARLRPGLFALLLPDVDRGRAERVGRAVEVELTEGGAGESAPCRVSPLSYPDDRAQLQDLAARAGGKGRLRPRRTAA